MSTKTKKIGLILNKRYDAFQQQKIELMNHAKIIEYLYNKPCLRVRDLRDLVTRKSDNIRIVRLDSNQMNLQIRPLMFMLRELMRLFGESYEQYKKYAKKTKMATIFFGHLPTESSLSTFERSVLGILDYYELHNILSYVYKWSFVIPHAELKTSYQLPPLNYTHPQVYDFYGMTYSHKQLIHFVIMCDNKTHHDTNHPNFPQVHLNDIIIQFILYQQNINLLRLNAKFPIKNQIKKFLKTIRNTTEYVCVGGIKPHYELFNQMETLPNDLINFMSEYEANHKIYIKIPVPKQLDDSDDEYYEAQTLANVVKPPNEDNFVVSNETLNEIIQFKEKFKPVRPKYRPEVERMFVQLVGKNSKKT